LREAIELYERYLDYLKSRRGLAPS
jgi:hypothetical protein